MRPAASPRVFLAEADAAALLEPGRLPCRLFGLSFDGGEVVHLSLKDARHHHVGRHCLALAVQGDDGFPDGYSAAEATLMVTPGAPAADPEAAGWRATVRSNGSTVPAAVEIVRARSELGARSKGVLETDALSNARVAVVGLGSGGSPVALALAQAGVGRLALIDRDRLEAGNVARHACGLGDLGRRKTAAVRDLCLGRNPDLIVDTLDADVLAEPGAVRAALKGADLLVAATDGDASRFALNRMALEAGTTALFGRALTRAASGEVLRVRPYRGACLACVYTERFLASRGREQASFEGLREEAPAYVPDADVEAQVQVGLASDIAPLSNLIVKLALVELSRSRGGGLESLEGDLSSDFYVWANRREGPQASWPPMGYRFDQPSILRWYGAAVGRTPACPVCGEADLPEANDDEGFFGG